MKLEFGDTEEYIKLRTDFNKETKSMAMLNKVGYIKWLEHKLVNNINYTRCCKTLKDKKQLTFDEWLKENKYTNIDNTFIKDNRLFSKKRLLNKYVHEYIYNL